jgi:polyhydroxybutyrate depolymerase
MLPAVRRRRSLLRRCVLPVLLLGVGALPGTAAAQSGGCGRPVTPGASMQTVVVGGVERTYLLVVPPAVAAAAPNPVVMGLHGGSDTAQNASRYMGLSSGDPVLYVYPQAPYWPEAGGVAWNVDPAGVDFPYFDALLADLGARHCVDTTRIFAAGQSNGAFMVNSLACFRPGLLRAIAPVAGGGPQTTRCPEGVAAMIVHGSADTTVPIGSGRWSRDHWLARNGDTGAPPVPADPSPCVSHPGSSRPVLWCQHGGGHSWPSWAGAAIRGFFLSRFGSAAPRTDTGRPPGGGGGDPGAPPREGASSPFVTIDRLSMSRGRARVRLTCRLAAPARCIGRLALTTAAKVRVGRRRRTLALGGTTFSLDPGERRTLRIRLSRTARSVLRRKRTLRVLATASSEGLRASRTLTLRRPR